MKRILVYNWKAETGKQSFDLFDLTNNMHIGWLKFLIDLCGSVNDHKSATSVDFRGYKYILVSGG